MTIGTPLWDEFVANLKEVKVTIEDMGFMGAGGNTCV